MIGMPENDVTLQMLIEMIVFKFSCQSRKKLKPSIDINFGV
jgi:hypothetical protein